MAFNFQFPDIGEGIHEGKILEWYHQPGDMVKEGDPLLKVETDKVVTDIPVPQTGKLAQTSGAVDEIVHVGQVIAVIVGKNEEVSFSTPPPTEAYHENDTTTHHSETLAKEKTASTDEDGMYGVVGQIPVGDEVLPSTNEGQPAVAENGASHGAKVIATPVARKMAADLGVDIAHIRGTGPSGRVMKSDIEAAARGGSAPAAPRPTQGSAPSAPAAPKVVAPAVPGEFPGVVEIEELSQLRRTIANRMSQSKYTAPHATSLDEVEVSKLVALRAQKNKELEREGIKISYLPFIIKAVCVALRKHKKLNATLDLERNRVVYKKYYNIGLAVDTPDGLVVPNIKNADQKGIIELAREIEDLSNRARERKLAIDEIRDGTFTITNYGSLNGQFGVPVINYPEVAILGTGRIQQKPVILNDQIAKGWIQPLSLSFDHRIVDGGDSARFVNDLVTMLADPTNILML
ncbi:MAG: 2-oxo acid dehydrogenase subunit E2 [Calditrichaeota bacterium]|nr:2-oxo acid dehydrogenase subunit E2 [Calditrichota bacterium]MCB9369003.1 2-oxo acid dehydrogenase subunit E2 [Calditrichota bacterium]